MQQAKLLASWLRDGYKLGLFFDSSETSVNYWTTQNYVIEESTLQEHSSL
jgi:hypothetical protein